MSSGSEKSTSVQPADGSKAVFNLPNQLTTARLILAVVLFVLIGCDYYMAAFCTFIVAAGTDWLDGYYARKYDLVTTLGRILDPFADKVIVCGTLIYLLSIPEMVRPEPESWWWGLKPWMVVVIVGRELLVTALRSFLEDRGADFSAKMVGKLKMVFQCFAAGAALFYLHYVMADNAPNHPAWAWWVLVVSIWGSVVLTVYSGLVYIGAAVKLLRDA